MEPAPELVAAQHMRTAWSRPAALEPRGALDVKVQVCCAFFSGTPADAVLELLFC